MAGSASTSTGQVGPRLTTAVPLAAAFRVVRLAVSGLVAVELTFSASRFKLKLRVAERTADADGLFRLFLYW